MLSLLLVIAAIVRAVVAVIFLTCSGGFGRVQLYGCVDLGGQIGLPGNAFPLAPVLSLLLLLLLLKRALVGGRVSFFRFGGARRGSI